MTAGRLRTILWWLAVAGIALLAGRAGLTLLRSPCVGVADNLDYWRVARPAGIQVDPAPRPGRFVECELELSEPALGTSLTSPAVMAWLARRLSSESFDLRQLGLLYWLASVLVLALVLRGGANAILVLLCAWVLYDPGFLLFFNSLYADPMLILGLAAAVLFLLLDPLGGSPEGAEGSADRRRSVLALAGLALAAAAAGSSKMLNMPFAAVLLTSLALGFVARRQRPRRRQSVLLAALLTLAVLAPLHFFFGPAPRFLDANNFNAVFGGIVRVASDGEAALEALGIPAEMLAEQPRSYYRRSPEVIAPSLPYLRQLSRLRLASLYLTDPPALWRTAEKIERELRRVRTHPRGNYTRAESPRGPRSYRAPVQLSVWKAHLLNPVPWWPLLLPVVIAGLLAYRAARSRWAMLDSVSLFLVSWIATQCAVVVLGDGFVSLHQHLLGARLGLDLLLVTTAGRLAVWGVRRREATGRRPGDEPRVPSIV